jgi:acetylglutamate kinase
MFTPTDSVKALLEEFPTLQTRQGNLAVVKLGGAAMEDSRVKDLVADQVAALYFAGLKVILVHGAGHEIGRWVKRLNLPEPRFIAGCRVTDSETMQVTEMVLGGLVNGELTSKVAERGAPAIGLSGRSARLTTARVIVGPNGEDLGHVGELSYVNRELFSKIHDDGYLPVMPCYSQTECGAPINLNGDYFAASLAGALNADWCFFLTNVPGVMKDGSVLPNLKVSEAEELIRDHTVTGGMIPKVSSAVKACQAGAKLTVITEASTPKVLIRILTGERGIGTIFN